MKPNINSASKGSDVLHSTYKRRFSDGITELITDFPGYVVFEYLAHKGIDKFFNSWTGEWGITGKGSASSGWYSGMTQKIWERGCYSEFLEFAPAAKEPDNVAF